MSKFAYNLYLDETGQFNEKGSAIVGFYVKYDYASPEQKNFMNTFHKQIEHFFTETITQVRTNPPTVWNSKIIKQLDTLNFYHCTENKLTGLERTYFQSYMINRIKNYLSDLKSEHLIEDFNIVVFSQEIKYDAFRIKDYALAVEVSRSRTYIDMLAEGIIKFWLDKKTNEPNSTVNIYISARTTAKNLGIASIEDYVKSIVINAGRFLNDKQKSALYNDLLDYYVDNNEKVDKLKKYIRTCLAPYKHKLSTDEYKKLFLELCKSNPKTSSELNSYLTEENITELTKLLNVKDYKKFTESDFHNYLYETYKIPLHYKKGKDLDLRGNPTNFSANEWKFKKLNILYNIKSGSKDTPNPITAICDYFANTYFHTILNPHKDEVIRNAYSKALGNTYITYPTLTNGLDMFVTYQQQLLDNNLFEILKKIIIDPNILQTRLNHDSNYKAAYAMNIDKYSGILEKALSSFYDFSAYNKRKLLDQITHELKDQVRSIDKKLKNFLAVTHLINFFGPFFEKDEWFKRYLIHFNLFLLKIHLDFNNLSEAEALYIKTKDKIHSNITLSPAEIEEFEGILIVSMLNYYSDTFNFNALQNLYSSFIQPKNVLSPQKAKATNILLSSKIKKIKLRQSAPDVILAEIDELKSYAIKNFSTALPEDSTRTYQIYAQLSALLSSENCVPSLYQAAEVVYENIEELYMKLFDGAFVASKQKFLYITFLDVLTHIDTFRDEFFSKNLSLKGIKQEASYPDCIIYWRLAKLAKKANDTNTDFYIYCNNELQTFIEAQPGNSIQEKLLYAALCSLSSVNNPTLLAIKIAITADYILATDCEKGIHLDTLKSYVRQLKSFNYLVCPLAEETIYQLEMIKSTSENLNSTLITVSTSIPF